MSRPVFPPLNKAILAMAAISWPQGFHVLTTGAPTSFAELQEYQHDHFGRIAVWRGGSRGTIYASPAVNHAFRAWHDFHHLAGGFDFSLEGEKLTAHAQNAALWIAVKDGKVKLSENELQICQALINSEIVGQGEYFHANQKFAPDQKKCTLEYFAKTFPHSADLLARFERGRDIGAEIRKSVFAKVRGVKGSRDKAPELSLYRPYHSSFPHGQKRFLLMISGAGDLDYNMCVELTEKTVAQFAALAGDWPYCKGRE